MSIRFKTTTLKPSLCDYSDAYILVKGRIIITEAGDDAVVRQADEWNKRVIFKNCSPFTNCKREIHNIGIDNAKIHNIGIDNAKDNDTVMPMYKLIEYSND